MPPRPKARSRTRTPSRATPAKPYTKRNPAIPAKHNNHVKLSRNAWAASVAAASNNNNNKSAGAYDEEESTA